ncbi:MAG: ABC transporter ATP-binding protein [Verrucomicrobiota bacterium]
MLEVGGSLALNGVVSEYAVDLRGIWKRYAGGVEALRGVDLQVPRGCVFGLLGPNGAGKSTLVKILMTIIRKSNGEGSLLGRAVGRKETLRRVGYLPEHARFPEYLTGEQVVRMSAGLCDVPRTMARKRTGELLERVGLEEWSGKRLRVYSKGMKQRVGLAQALVNEPEIVFLDEPTDGVDPAGRRDIRLLLQSLRKEGKTVFVNSHLLGELEMVCDEVAILSKGQVVLKGALSELTGQQVDYRLACGSVDSGTRAFLEEKGCLWEDGELVVKEGKAEAVMPVVDELRRRGVVLEGLRRSQLSLEDLFIETVGEDTPGADRKGGE